MTFSRLSRVLGFDFPTVVDTGMNSPARVARAMRAGIVPSDLIFDQFLPHDLKVISHQHWTPLAVSICASRWLERLGVRHVVDLGSGAGKFCVAGALATHMRFTGIEQRLRLVQVAHGLARSFDVDDRIHFTRMVLGTDEIPHGDAYYLYNPFEENLFYEEDWIDAEVDHTRERFIEGVQAVRRLLLDAPSGTFVLTYNGFGGNVPPTYEEVEHGGTRPRILRLWRKTSALLPRSAH